MPRILALGVTGYDIRDASDWENANPAPNYIDIGSGGFIDAVNPTEDKVIRFRIQEFDRGVMQAGQDPRETNEYFNLRPGESRMVRVPQGRRVQLWIEDEWEVGTEPVKGMQGQGPFKMWPFPLLNMLKGRQ